MTKVGEHITLDIIGTTQEYDPSVYESVIRQIAKAADVTILLYLNSFLTISSAIEGLIFPQVKKSKLIIPFSGNVWKLMWLSANKASIVKPCGLNLYLEISRIVTSAAFAIWRITLS